MARVNVYMRPVDAVSTNSANVNDINQAETHMKIKVEPPELDGENPIEQSAANCTKPDDDSDKLHNDEKNENNSVNVPSTESTIPSDHDAVERTAVTSESKQLQMESPKSESSPPARKGKRWKPSRSENCKDQYRLRRKQAESNYNFLDNSRLLRPEKILIADRKNLALRRKLTLQNSKDAQLKDERLLRLDLYACSVCFVLFDSLRMLDCHIQRYVTAHWYNCRCCSSRFLWINEYKQHVKVCSRTEYLRSIGCINYDCHFCSANFRFKNTLQSHIFHCHYDEICPMESSKPSGDAVAEEDSSTLPQLANATDVSKTGKMTPKRSRNDDDQLSTPGRRMRQTMLTEFLHSSAKKRKMDDDSSQSAIVEEDSTKGATDNVENATISSNGEAAGSAMANESKKPFVQIHINSEIMSFLLNSTADVKTEVPEDCPSTDAQDTSRNITHMKTVEESLSNAEENKKREENIVKTPKTRKKRTKPTSNNLKNMLNCKLFSIPLIRCDYMLKDKAKTRRSSLSSQVSSMSSVFSDLQGDNKHSLELKNLEIPLIRLDTCEDLPVIETKVEVLVKNEAISGTTSEHGDVKAFRCKVCKKSFNLKENLHEHMELFHVAYMSSICKARYTSKTKLLEHYLRQHMIFDRSKCCICHKKFDKRAGLKRHLAVHCIKIVRSQRDSLPINVEVKCNRFRKLHKCKECGKKFWLATCLKQHFALCLKRKRSIAAEEKDETKPRVISTSSPKKQPVRMSVSPSRDQTSTGDLKRERLNQSLANTSVSTDLSSKLSEYEPQTPTSQRPLQDGADPDARGVEKWIYPCNVCGRQFQTLANLYSHQRSFAKPANKRCNICGTCFTTKRHLQSHVTATHALSAMPEQYKFRCKFCNQGFMKKGNQRQHEGHFHSHDQPIQTAVDSSLLNSEQLWNVNTVCTICNLMFESYDRFIEHNMYYYKGQIFTCTFCGQTFHGMYMLNHHNKLVHYPEETLKSYTYTCDLCNEGFNHESHFHAHKLHVHLNDATMTQAALRSREVEKYPALTLDASATSSVETKQLPINAFTCAVCDLNFTNAKDLNIHKMEYSSDGEFQCDKCERKCSTYSVLKKHQSLNHTGCDIHSSYKCRFCGEVMTTNVSMMCHEKHFHMNDAIQRDSLEILRDNATKQDVAENNVNDDNLACLTCGMRFKDEMGLKYHFLEYSDIGEHVCKVCHRRFAELHRLEIHKLKHSRLNNILSGHRCPICHEGFTSVTHVRTHVLHLHGHETFPNVFVKRANNSNEALVRQPEVQRLLENTKESSSSLLPGADNSKIFSTDRFTGTKCLVCNLTFSDGKKLARHRLRYINSGSYICEFCGRRFPWETAFKQHLRKHLYSGERCVMKHRCPDCSERFRTAIAAHSHVVHVHNKDKTVDEAKDLEKLMEEAGIKDATIRLVEGHTEKAISDDESELDDVLPGDVVEEKTGSRQRSYSIESSGSSSKVDDNEVSIVEQSPDIIQDIIVTSCKSSEVSKTAEPSVAVPSGSHQAESSRPSEKRSFSYVCPICVTRISCLSEFKLHILQNHGKSTDKPKTKQSTVQSDVIECMFCESFFMYESNFKAHIDRVHMPRVQKSMTFLQFDDDRNTTPASTMVSKPTPEDGDAIEILWEKKDDDLEVIEIDSSQEDTAPAQQQPANHSQSTLSEKKDRDSTSESDHVGKLKVKSFAKIVENLAQGSKPVVSPPWKQRSPKVTNVTVLNDQDKIDNTIMKDRIRSIDSRHQAYLQTFLNNIKQ